MGRSLGLGCTADPGREVISLVEMVLWGLGCTSDPGREVISLVVMVLWGLGCTSDPVVEDSSNFAVKIVTTVLYSYYYIMTLSNTKGTGRP